MQVTDQRKLIRCETLISVHLFDDVKTSIFFFIRCRFLYGDVLQACCVEQGPKKLEFQ